MSALMLADSEVKAAVVIVPLLSFSPVALLLKVPSLFQFVWAKPGAPANWVAVSWVPPPPRPPARCTPMLVPLTGGTKGATVIVTR